MKSSLVRKFAVGTILSLLAVGTASAQSMKDQLVGAWSAVSNVEEYADGKKVAWEGLQGTAMFDAGERFMLMMAEGNRKKVEGNPAMNPVGRMISYFGTYTINDADKTLTFKIIGASAPIWDGAEQKRVVTTLDASALVLKTLAPIPTPQGPFTPVVTWKKM